MRFDVSLSGAGKLYLWVVVGAGVAAVVHSSYAIYVQPIGYQWLILAALTLISGSATVRLVSVPATISISETFVFTSVLLFGAAPGTLTVALDTLVMSFWLARRRPEVLRVLFNLSAPALSIWIASQAFFLTAGVRPLVDQPSHITQLVLPLMILAPTSPRLQ